MIRPLRGRVVIREDKRLSSIILHPDENPREQKTHRGEVIALGEPFMLPSGALIPWPFVVGDVVQYHFEAAERGRTTEWGDAGVVCVMAAREVDCVWHDVSV
jgi:co-chaperonin GroES (HSP10)